MSRTMRGVLAILITTIPAFLFLNAWQVFRYEMMGAEVEALEIQQRELLESNKSVIIEIEMLGSPTRIDKLATSDEDLIHSNTGRRIRIEIEPAGGGSDG
jgi:hypothetical protein